MTVSFLDIVSEYTQFAVCVTNVVVYDDMINVYIYIYILSNMDAILDAICLFII